MFMAFDRVRYVGDKLLSYKGVKGVVGEVVAKVDGEKNTYVVEFGEDSFVVSGESLQRHIPTPKEEAEIQMRRRRRDFEEEL